MTKKTCKFRGSVNITETYIMGSDYRQKIQDCTNMSNSKFEDFFQEIWMEAIFWTGILSVGEIIELIPG